MVNDIIKIELTTKSVRNFNNEIKIQLSNLKLCCLKALLRYNRATSNTFDLFDSWLTFWRRNYYFFLNFSTPVYKMWIIQEPNTLELWNKLHFEEKKTDSI